MDQTILHPATVASAAITTGAALQGANWQTLLINAGFTLLMHAVNAFISKRQSAQKGGEK